MPSRRHYQTTNRAFATGPLTVRPHAGPAAQEITLEFLEWALDMIEEHEVRSYQAGVGNRPWLRGHDGDRIRQRLEAAVAAAVQIRHDPGYFAKQFSSVKVIASRAEVDRSHLLRDLGTEVQLLPPIMAAGFAFDGLLGPFRALTIYEDSGRAGRDSNAFGVHRQKQMAPLSRMFGIAGVGVDTVVPLTAQPLVTRTSDDPGADGTAAERLEHAQEVAAVTRASVPSTVDEHLRAALVILRKAVRILAGGMAQSVASGSAGIHPRDALERGFPRWLVGPPIRVGPGTSRQSPIGGRFVSPGTDPEMLRVARDAGLLPLFSVTNGIGGSRLSSESREGNPLVYTPRADQVVTGNRLEDALLALDASVIPGMRDLAPAELELVKEQAMAMAVPLPEGVRYAFVPSGTVLSNTNPALPVGIVLRQTLAGTFVWSTTADFRRAELRAEAVVAAELAVRLQQRAEVSNCVSRFFADHCVHEMQASGYETRMALRTVTMIANLGVVGVNRMLQVGRGPT